MTHGYEDLAGRAPKKVVHSLYDLGELATRLESPNTFDRLGDTMFMDSFEYNMGHWEISTGGTASSADLSELAVRSKRYSCKMDAGNVANASVQITAYNPYPYATRLGLEFSIAMQYTDDQWELILYIIKDSKRYKAEIGYHHPSNVLYYIDESNNPVELENAYLIFAWFKNFYTYKMVVDIETMQYVRVLAYGKLWDLEGKNLYYDDVEMNNHLEIAIKYTALTVNTKTCFVDDVILTQNEP